MISISDDISIVDFRFNITPFAMIDALWLWVHQSSKKRRNADFHGLSLVQRSVHLVRIGWKTTMLSLGRPPNIGNCFPNSESALQEMQATICLSFSGLAVVYIYMLRFDDAEHTCHRMLHDAFGPYCYPENRDAVILIFTTQCIWHWRCLLVSAIKPLQGSWCVCSIRELSCKLSILYLSWLKLKL